MRGPLVALVCLLGAAATAVAQELTYDQNTGNYRFRYYSDVLDRHVVAEIVPPNKVAPKLELIELEFLDSRAYEYVYRLSNQRIPQAVQRLRSVELRCPDPDETELLPPQGWVGYQLGTSAWSNGPTPCVFSADGAEPIPPGGSLAGYRVRTPWLPGIAEGYFRGRTPPFYWPEDGIYEHDPQLYAIIATVDGLRGGWKTAPTVAPVRDPRQLRDSSDVIDALRSDLDRVCGDLGWISDAELCKRFNDGLSDLENALGADRAEWAQAALAAFLDTLDQGRNGMRGNAYWLLRINALFLQTKLR